MTENNKVNICGKIAKEIEFDHEIHGEKFFRTDIATERLSGTVDLVPILVPEVLLSEKMEAGECVGVTGSFRSYNRCGEDGRKLILKVFADEIELLENAECSENAIELDGYICKEPAYRKTPLGREITDILLAVNRAYGKSDYIPCIAWGRTARFASELPVGEHIKIKGRIQSRTYTKRVGENAYIERTTYEVSISLLETEEKEGEKR